MSTHQYVRATAIAYLAGLGPETARQKIVAGTFGPRFQPRGRERETLLRLDQVIAVLGLDEAGVAAAVTRYLADRKLARPPVVVASVKSLRRVRS